MSSKECPAKSVKRKCQERLSSKECQERVSSKSVVSRVSSKSVKQECPARVSSKSVKNKCQERLSSKECQERVFSKRKSRGKCSFLEALIVASGESLVKNACFQVSSTSVQQECQAKMSSKNVL